MKIERLEERSPELISELTDVWERSVRATHTFLSGAEVKAIREYVPDALAGVDILVAAFDGGGRAAGFMGVAGGKLEMLFLAPEERGRGLGKRLLRCGVERYGVNRLDVNEQNPDARGFYERMGFTVRSRSELDAQGQPYPILHMSL